MELIVWGVTRTLLWMQTRKLVSNKEAFNKMFNTHTLEHFTLFLVKACVILSPSHTEIPSYGAQHLVHRAANTSQVQAASEWIRLTDQRRWVMDSEMKGGERRWNVPACWCQRSCDVSGSGTVSEMPPRCTQCCVARTHMPRVPLTHELVQTQPAELEWRKAARDRYRR